MKRKEIIVLLKEILGSKIIYSFASLTITIVMLSGITIILRNDIRDIKDYVQSVVDRNPEYSSIQEKVQSSVYTANIPIDGKVDVEAFIDKKGEEKKNNNGNVSGGYDSYTPTQTITDNSSNKSSNEENNIYNGASTSVANNNNNSNAGNAINGESDNSGSSNESKKEDVLDRSSFNGKDIMISEGEPFNPMNGLQLAATDINGKNITNKIVIKENNVDTYKPGLYTVKAAVELSDKSNLEKEFFVRVEPTVLNLVVNDMRASKDVLEKSEKFNLSFSVKSSKSYLEVASVNVNNKDYTVKKVSSSSFLRKSNKYEVDLVAPSKGGVEKIQIKSVTMSDGTVVDVDKSVQIDVLREEAQITDAVIKNIYDENKNISLEYKLEDVDDVIEKVVFYLYNKNNIIIQKEELEKNNKSYIDLNINENGNYKVEIKGYYKEDIVTASELYKEKELFVQNLEVDKFNGDNITSYEKNDISDEEDLTVMSPEYIEEYAELNLTGVGSYGKSSFRNSQTITESKDVERNVDVKVEGRIADDQGTLPSGNYNITIPSKVAFSVDNHGVFTGVELPITNNGNDDISVKVSDFVDTDGDAGIKLNRENDLSNSSNNANKPRSEINLTLQGNRKKVYLGNGEVKDGLGDSATDLKNVEMAEVGVGVTEKLKLSGEAGKQNLGTNVSGITNSFTLTFKISKK